MRDPADMSRAVSPGGLLMSRRGHDRERRVRDHFADRDWLAFPTQEALVTAVTNHRSWTEIREQALSESDVALDFFHAGRSCKVRPLALVLR